MLNAAWKNERYAFTYLQIRLVRKKLVTQIIIGDTRNTFEEWNEEDAKLLNVWWSFMNLKVTFSFT